MSVDEDEDEDDGDGDGDDDDNDDNAKLMECRLCPRDTVSTLCIVHSSPLPCDRGPIIFPICQMRNGSTQIK